MDSNRDLYTLPSGLQTRWACAENPEGLKGKGGSSGNGRKGSPFKKLKSGESFILAAYNGSGTIRRIWITLDTRTADILKGVEISFYWDNSTSPAIKVPLADLFCQPLGRMSVFENYCFSNPDGNSLNSSMPMPFRKSMLIKAENKSDTDIKMFFYQVEYTINDEHDDKTGYFHALYRRENPTVLLRDYTIVPHIQGLGKYLGCSMGINVNRRDFGNSWWGEGEVKIYLDGDSILPTLCGTGTEDYVGAAWGLTRFSHLYQGCPIHDDKTGQYAFYRLHIKDPVCFYHDIKVTIQQIGQSEPAAMIKFMEEKQITNIDVPGYGQKSINLDFLRENDPYTYNIERYDDVCSTAYLYLDRPEL